MNRRGNAAIWIIIAIVVMAGLAAVYFGPRLLSVIGEEGYEPYDPLLLSGSYDTAKWIYANTTYSGGEYGCVGGATSCNGGTQVCSAPLVPYTGVTSSTNAITISPVGYGRNDGYQGPYIRTVNLRLVNFRFDWSISVTRCSSNKWWHGGGVVKTNRGVVYTFPEGSGSSPTGPVGIELTWDDFQLGHYQIKANGQVVQEGNVGEGEELYFQIEPDTSACNSECSGTATISNPRWKQLFGCDLQAGELQTDACFGGPQTVTTDDLPGFKRFCIDSPSTFLDAGISTSSKRVYYDLAAGKPVVIGANQAWKFSYIGDAPLIGNRTGIDSNCQQVLVEDRKDLPSPDPIITGTTLYWTSSGRYDGVNAGWRFRNLDLKSGTQTFMHTEPISIDERICPYTDEWQEFPGDPLNPSCFSVQAFGKTFKKGDIQQLPGVSVTLQDIAVEFKNYDGYAGKVFRYTATWRLDFQPTAVTIDLANTPATIGANAGPIQYPIKNGLPGPGTIVTTLQVRPEILNEPIFQTYTTKLNAGQAGTVAVTLPETFQGKARTLAWNTLQTPAGGVPFASAEVTYSTTPSGSNTVPVEVSSWWTKILAWFKGIWAWAVGLWPLG